MSNKIVTKALQNQFESTFVMAAKLVEVCPDGLWLEKCEIAPFWLYVYHIVFFMDFWLRDAYDGSEFRSMVFDGRITPELDAELFDGLFVSRDDMRRYLAVIHEKTDRIFAKLDDDMLAVPIIDGHPQYTYADVITGQIRHVMYNIGFLNGVLRVHDLPASEWYAYNEREGS